MSAWQGSRAEPRGLMEQSLAMLRETGDRAEIGLALEGIGWAHFASGEDEAAFAAFEECLALAQEQGDPRMIARARAGVGQALVALHRTDEARRVAEEIIADGAARGDRRNEHFGWHFLADCALIDGRCAESLPLYRRSLELARLLGDRLEIGFEIQGVAMSLAGLGENERAATLGAAVDAEFARLGADADVGFWNALLERYLGGARRAIDGEAAARATATGRALPLDEAIARALDPGREAP
jgi:tetratricopeptide (TPR) repeat protein